MAKTFDDLVRRSTSTRIQARGRKLAEQYLAQIVLQQLRERRGISQQTLAAKLAIRQPTLSKLERQSDIKISTLKRVIEALGGKLIVRAQFKQFEANLVHEPRVRRKRSQAA